MSGDGDPFRALLARRAGGPHETLAALREGGRLYGLTAYEVDGRRVRVERDRWCVDFASCNYLGYDLSPEVIASVLPALERYGTHPSWARLAAGPDLYGALESALAQKLGAEDTIVLPTISLISVGLIPALVTRGGVIVVDRFAHKVNHDGCRIARDRGATLVSVPHATPDAIDEALSAHRDAGDKLVVIDGVLSVTGASNPVVEIARVAARHGALVYVDDAHGFGILGRSPTAERPYGLGGGGVVQHQGGSLDNVVYVAGLSKAYSSLAAFFTVPRALRAYFEVSVTGYVYSGPCPTASLATALAGLALDAREGDQRRDQIYSMSRALGDGLAALGYEGDANGGFPIQSCYLGAPERVIAAGRHLYERGFLATMQAYPVVAKDRGVIRFTVTAANTMEQVHALLDAMRSLREVLR